MHHDDSPADQLRRQQEKANAQALAAANSGRKWMDDTGGRYGRATTLVNGILFTLMGSLVTASMVLLLIASPPHANVTKWIFGGVVGLVILSVGIFWIRRGTQVLRRGRDW